MLLCGDAGPPHRSPALPVVAVPPRPGRAEIDPLLAAPALVRLLVAGTDADLAAVLVRLLRRERLDVEVAFVPSGGSDAARVWGLPRDAAALAVEGSATPVPLIRDDSGGVLVGRALVRDVTGECYADDTLVLRGHARRLVVEAGPAGVSVRAGYTERPPDGRVRAVPPRAPRGRGSALARAVQVGGSPFVPALDGVPYPRAVPRFAWYRHTADWLLVTR